MAWKVTKRIWDTAREIKQSDKLLLLALAEFADEQSVCWPSYETLAEMIGVNRRSAIRIVENLEEWGHIYIDQHAVGRSNTNTFLIVTGLTSPEVEKVLIDRFGKSPDDANLSTNSLMGKQDDYRKGVTHNTKSFPESGRYKRPKGVKADAKSVTDNTISHSQKGVMREQKVLPVTQKGVMDDTRTIIEPSIKPPNGVGDKSPPPESDKPKKQLMGTFLAETGLKMPHRKSDVGFWWSAIGEIYNLVDNDVGRGSDIIRRAVKRMKADKLTISGPNSIINICRPLLASSTNGPCPARSLDPDKQATYDELLAAARQKE